MRDISIKIIGCCYLDKNKKFSKTPEDSLILDKPNKKRYICLRSHLLSFVFESNFLKYFLTQFYILHNSRFYVCLCLIIVFIYE